MAKFLKKIKCPKCKETLKTNFAFSNWIEGIHFQYCPKCGYNRRTKLQNEKES